MSQNAIAVVTIANKLGLHARPAMLFVETAGRYDADVAVRRLDQSEIVDGKSIMQMMVLAATRDTKIEISATGRDAEAAIAALVELVEAKFQEE